MNTRRNQLSLEAAQPLESRVMLATPTPAEMRAAARQAYVDDLYAQYLQNPNTSFGKFGITAEELLEANAAGGLVPTGYAGDTPTALETDFETSAAIPAPPTTTDTSASTSSTSTSETSTTATTTTSPQPKSKEETSKKKKRPKWKTKRQTKRRARAIARAEAKPEQNGAASEFSPEISSSSSTTRTESTKTTTPSTTTPSTTPLNSTTVTRDGYEYTVSRSGQVVVYRLKGF